MATVVTLRIHPVSGEPGIALETVEIEADGLAGDRRKKAAVHLVGAQDAATTRSNIVVTVDGSQLLSWIGSQISIGSARLAITRTAGSCAGVYAQVLQPGRVGVGDAVEPVLNPAGR